MMVQFRGSGLRISAVLEWLLIGLPVLSAMPSTSLYQLSCCRNMEFRVLLRKQWGSRWCKVLCANSAQTKWELQAAWLLKTKHLRVFSLCLVDPLCQPIRLGGNLEAGLMEARIRQPKDFQNWKVNWGPRSETISWGKLWIRKTCCISRAAVWPTVGILANGMRWHTLENLSTTTTTRITVLPWDFDRPVTKSNDIWDQGRVGMGRECSKPSGWVLGSLFWEHTEHAATKAWTSFCMLGHQNLGGHYLGLDVVVETFSLRSRFTTGLSPSPCSWIWLGGFPSTSCGSNCLERVFPFLESERYERVMSKWLKNKAHWAWREFNLLASRM